MTALLLCGILLGIAALINGAMICSHRNVSLPRSVTVDVAGTPYISEPYQVCLDCGQKRHYVIGTEPGEIKVGPWFSERPRLEVSRG